MFRAALDAVVVMDTAGAVRDWNPAAEALFGYRREEAMGREVAELIIPPPLRDVHRRALRRYVETGERHMLDRRLALSALRRDGSEIGIELSVTRLPDTAPPMFAGFIRSDEQDAARTRATIRQQQRMSFLAQAGLVLEGSLDYQETLRRLVELTVPDLAHLAIIDLLDHRGAGIQMAVAAARDPAQARAVERVRATSPLALSGGHPVGVVLRSGEAMLLATLSERFLSRVAQSSEHLTLMRRMGYHSAMTVPLVARGRTLGTLSMIRMADGAAYDEDDFLLAKELARRAALAVENARLYESARSLAHTLQQSLLPPALPEIAGLRVAARYRAAAQGHDVGGDFYDLFALAADTWALTIGDVCGKGAEAAALTALARYTIRALTPRSPAQVLRRLNQAMIRERDAIRGRFLTAVFAAAVVQEGAVRLELAAGGHPPPLVLRGGGTVERVPAGGPLIGMDPAAEFPAVPVTLHAGDQLVLYTDGLTDAHAPGRILSEADLCELLAAGHGRPADELAAFLEQSATDGRDVRDDIALLVIEVTGDR